MRITKSWSALASALLASALVTACGSTVQQQSATPGGAVSGDGLSAAVGDEGLALPGAPSDPSSGAAAGPVGGQEHITPGVVLPRQRDL